MTDETKDVWETPKLATLEVPRTLSGEARGIEDLNQFQNDGSDPAPPS